MNTDRLLEAWKLTDQNKVADKIYFQPNYQMGPAT